ncbi:hypothetical protein AMJ85_11980 [candidate division BRC1 bacterium SM23_51]|nr:MAG: hypothetical protein AMJ85_11980 [candidate division BRC1 bacterium SM23_51]
MCLAVVTTSNVFSDQTDVMSIDITVSPSTLALDSEGVWVTVHTDIAYSEVAGSTLKLNGIDVAWTKADARGDLVAKFSLDLVKEIVQPPQAELTLTGFCKDGTAIEGSDIVGVTTGSDK